jgi:hypothetical protein
MDWGFAGPLGCTILFFDVIVWELADWVREGKENMSADGGVLLGRRWALGV